jgi:hypothetical protein
VAEIRFNCFECGTELVFSQTPGRRDECPKCGADVHVCRNCKNYDIKAYNECREPQADRVQEKDRSNFCDYFDPAAPGGKSETDKQKDLRAAAEALFKNFKK